MSPVRKWNLCAVTLLVTAASKPASVEPPLAHRVTPTGQVQSAPTITISPAASIDGKEGTSTVTVVSPPPAQTSVLPDGGNVNAPANTTDNQVTFYVQNNSASDQTYSLGCLKQYPVTDCQHEGSLFVAAGSGQNTLVTFWTGAPGTGRVTLNASASGGADQGYYIVNVQ